MNPQEWDFRKRTNLATLNIITIPIYMLMWYQCDINVISILNSPKQRIRNTSAWWPTKLLIKYKTIKNVNNNKVFFSIKNEYMSNQKILLFLWNLTWSFWKLQTIVPLICSSYWMPLEQWNHSIAESLYIQIRNTYTVNFNHTHLCGTKKESYVGSRIDTFVDKKTDNKVVVIIVTVTGSDV